MNPKEEKKRKPVRDKNHERDLQEQNRRARQNEQRMWKHINTR